MKNIYLLILTFMLISCGDKSENAVMDEALKEEISCPAGAIEEISEWGELGFSRSCKMRHGTFIGWEYGYKVVEGNYINGKKQGVWTWYDQEGNIKKKITYKSGKEVEETE